MIGSKLQNLKLIDKIMAIFSITGLFIVGVLIVFYNQKDSSDVPPTEVKETTLPSLNNQNTTEQPIKTIGSPDIQTVLEVRWINVGGGVLPSTKGDGPGIFNNFSVSKFENTEEGAGMAATHFLHLTTLGQEPSVFETAINNNFYANDELPIFRENLQSGYSEDDVLFPKNYIGWTVTRLNNEEVLVEVHEDSEGKKIYTIRLTWQGSDWKALAPQNGSWDNALKVSDQKPKTDLSELHPAQDPLYYETGEEGDTDVELAAQAFIEKFIAAVFDTNNEETLEQRIAILENYVTPELYQELLDENKTLDPLPSAGFTRRTSLVRASTFFYDPEVDLHVFSIAVEEIAENGVVTVIPIDLSLSLTELSGGFRVEEFIMIQEREQ